MTGEHRVFALLALFVAALVSERLIELTISARHVRALPKTAREFGSAHFALFVVLHTLYPLALGWEILRLGARPGPLWPAWLAGWACAQGLRGWSILSLGTSWNVRIWVVPGAERKRRGPYRWLRHPNYLAVAIELFTGSMLWGATRTALAFTALNAVALAIRIPAEDRALAWAAAQPEPNR